MSATATPHLLIVGTMNRPDVVSMFRGVEARMTFLEYEDNWGTPLDPRIYEPYGEVTTWERHWSADALLEQVAPDRVAMISIGSREQVALRSAAAERGLEVLHVEHGYRLPLETRMTPEIDETRDGDRSPGWRRHAFFLGSLARRRNRAALLRYAYGTVRGGSHALLLSSADLRRADRYVSYSPECFAFHREADQIPRMVEEKTIYTGVPQFDCFRGERSEADPDAVLLIDHQLHNAGLLGWDEAFRRTWVQQLFEVVCERAGKTLYVKEHPGDVGHAWDAYMGRGVVRLGSLPEVAQRARSTPLVLGIMSTLQMPVAAQEHTAMVSLEIHPRPGPALSRRFVEAGVCEPVSSFDDLAGAILDVERIHASQAPNKRAFTKQFLHRLDGQASRRLADGLARPG